jgi:nitrate reductase assembly molybdenum cofactor insertion protein NarJ
MSILADQRLHELLQQAAAWRILGLLFERPREGWLEELEGLSREVLDPEITAAASAARGEASEGFYLALLGPGGPVSAREVSYRGMEDPGHLLADVEAFYQAFAFSPQTEEAPDHLSVEAGFLGYLCLKEAYALARGNDEEAEVAARASAKFREDHLATFAWAVAERLQPTDVRYLTLAAKALAARSGPCQEAGISPGRSLPVYDGSPTDCSQE